MNSISSTPDATTIEHRESVEGSDATIMHSAWCDPTECSVDMSGGYPRDVIHYSHVAMFKSGAPLGEDSLTAGICLSRAVNLDGSSEAEGGPWPDEGVDLVRVDIDGRGVVTLDQLEEFGRWLTSRAAEYRAAIEAEAH